MVNDRAHTHILCCDGCCKLTDPIDRFQVAQSKLNDMKCRVTSSDTTPIQTAQSRSTSLHLRETKFSL